MIPKPGRRARYVAVKAAYGGGGFAGALGLTYAVLATEAKLARKTIGVPFEQAPRAAGSYGRGRRGDKPVHLVVIGDSSAAGLGCERAEQTPGALLAGGIARDLRTRVDLDVVAVTGARSADLEVQVARAMRRPVDVAVIVIGANDVTHRVPIASSARDLARAVTTLRKAGAQVVVGTCPDLGTVKPVMQPLRTVAAKWSRRLAAAQTVATVEAGGVAVSLGDLLAAAFHEHPHLWSIDRFHPSAEGYRRMVDALLPSVLESLGVEIAVSVPISDSVQDVQLAARVAAREPGVEVDPLPEADGQSRLARLRRRLPLVGRGAPEGPTDPAELAAVLEGGETG
ncbi:MAG: SGNH/GDSL hydrolase family protein [Frankiales bacterium]|nr:MAG: SGNH/GDSL hydrolase family protein [Frankiales bacterium]